MKKKTILSTLMLSTIVLSTLGANIASAAVSTTNKGLTNAQTKVTASRATAALAAHKDSGIRSRLQSRDQILTLSALIARSYSTTSTTTRTRTSTSTTSGTTTSGTTSTSTSTSTSTFAPLTSAQQQTLLNATPMNYSVSQLDNLSLAQLAVPYDYYDYNILASFQQHSLTPMQSGFTAVNKVTSSTGSVSYVQAKDSYTAAQLTAAQNLMSGFATALSGKTTDQQKAQAIVQYVADHVTYSLAGNTTDEQVGDLVNRGIYLGNLSTGYIAAAQNDYGEALEAFTTNSGVCMQYAELLQLGYLYAGLNSTMADNVNKTLVDYANNGGTDYLHAYNYVTISGNWYLSDSTWYDSGTTGSGYQQWMAAGSTGVKNYDYYVPSISYGTDPTLTNWGVHTTTANGEAIPAINYLY